MNVFIQSAEFAAWMRRLRDRKGRGSELYLLLAGGDKGTQKRDIQRAVELARQL